VTALDVTVGLGDLRARIHHTENHMVLWELTKQGLGIGVIIDEVGDAEPRVATRARQPR
jgi:hypothetical protein